MNKPMPWECKLWKQTLDVLEGSGRTHSSYYVLAQEHVRRCEEDYCYE